MRSSLILLLLPAVLMLSACSSSENASSGGGSGISVDLPGGSDGIPFDDLVYSAKLMRIIAATGSARRIDLVDPDTLMVTPIDVSSNGVQSADEGAGLIFAA